MNLYDTSTKGAIFLFKIKSTYSTVKTIMVKANISSLRIPLIFINKYLCNNTF